MFSKFVRVRVNSFAIPNVSGALLGATTFLTQESFVVVVGGVQLGTAAPALPGKAIKPTPKAATDARTSPTRLLVRISPPCTTGGPTAPGLVGWRGSRPRTRERGAPGAGRPPAPVPGPGHARGAAPGRPSRYVL